MKNKIFFLTATFLLMLSPIAQAKSIACTVESEQTKLSVQINYPEVKLSQYLQAAIADSSTITFEVGINGKFESAIMTVGFGGFEPGIYEAKSAPLADGTVFHLTYDSWNSDPVSIRIERGRENFKNSKCAPMAAAQNPTPASK